jgi:putative thioredoxin
MSESPHIYEVTADNFEQIVIRGSFEQPVLVDFWATWCQPCQILMPLLAKLADEYQGRFVLAKLNTEEHQALAAQFGIRSIPNVKLFVNGQEVDEFAGALPESAVREFLERYLPRESDGSVETALQSYAAGDAEGALKLLAEAQSADPGNTRIVIAIAQINAATGNTEAAESALDSLPLTEQEDHEVKSLRSQMFFAKDTPSADEVEGLKQRLVQDENDSEARYKLAMALLQAGHFEPAIDQLLTLMAKDRQFNDEAAYKALLKIFEMLGDDPLVVQTRRRMFNMMH